MLLIESNVLYEHLEIISRYVRLINDPKLLYLSLYDAAGNPVHDQVPKKIIGLKKVEKLEDRFVFHAFGGRSSFAVLKVNPQLKKN